MTPVFGGVFFKYNDLNITSSTFPPGWTIVIRREEDEDEQQEQDDVVASRASSDTAAKGHHSHRFHKPSLHNDSLFISSISYPSTKDFKPVASPTRQIAMMLWATLHWYFHQPEPPSFVTTEASKSTPDEAKPRGEWRINIKKEGVFRGRNVMQKLERMGLIYSEDSTVGANTDGEHNSWNAMFASKKAFWMLPARLFLFTLSPASASTSGSSHAPRPTSPVSYFNTTSHATDSADHNGRGPLSPGLWSGPSAPGPYTSGSHLPTYYPPPPAQHVMSNGVRHPIRPKPPRQGEVFYTRYVPSVKQHLSFRVASLSGKAVVYQGPEPVQLSTGANGSKADPGQLPTTEMSDLQLLHKWMNNPRVSKFWGCAGPISTQESFLRGNLESKHSFPAIGCWDGKPFGYFEIYWVKEDILGKNLGPGEVDDWDRGVHVLVGEEEFRGKHRLGPWITSLAHWALTSDYRTNSVVLEPRIDNTRYVLYSFFFFFFAI